ncbi:MAG TPA: DNA-deoxyinosine glycosylase, partial [Stellaceae bacterium]|nr:DNA-deoxyinosine glycosylase [Stellaceae bacterium]
MRTHHAVAPAHPWPDGGSARALRRLTTPPLVIPKRSFAPVIGDEPRALVLGTLPGEESLRQVKYYAHPRNLFWPTIHALFGATPSENYDQRLAFVRTQHIALWDVCEMAERR